MEASIVHFCELDSEVMTFLPGVTRNVAIPVHRVEQKRGNSANFVRHQIPLILSWAFTIHKAQGNTIYCAVINLVTSKKCWWNNLVALFRVRELKHLLLKPFSVERIVKVNKEKPSPIILAALQNLNVKAISTKTTLQIIWDHINNQW